MQGMVKVLQECLDNAKESLEDHPRFKHKIHWCYLIQDGRTISRGENVAGSPPDSLLIRYPDYSLVHSEACAFIRAGRDLDRNRPWTAVNIRLNRQGVMRNAAPCPCCYRLLKAFGCKQFYFTTDAGFASME
jgi:hypothetical protein